MCGDWYLAEDVAQEALIRVYRSWHRIRRRESLPGYARQTVVRLRHRRAAAAPSP